MSSNTDAAETLLFAPPVPLRASSDATAPEALSDEEQEGCAFGEKTQHHKHKHGEKGANQWLKGSIT